MTKEKVTITAYTEVWTGKNKVAISNFLSDNLISHSFTDEHLYVNRLGGYIDIDTKFTFLVDYNVLLRDSI